MNEAAPVTQPIDEKPYVAASSLWHSTWSLPALIGGVVLVVPMRYAPGWLASSLATRPWWLMLIAGMVLPTLVLLVYPLLTRKQARPHAVRLPSLKRVLTELAIAMPILVVIAGTAWAAQIFILRFAPGEAKSVGDFGRMAEAADIRYVLGLLLLTFLFAPVIEEVFFRGFLFNGLRKRMPLLAALLLSTIIFALLHRYGPVGTLVVAVHGGVFSLIYLWRKTLLTPIFVHAGYNFLVAVGMLLAIQANAGLPVLGVIHEEGTEACVICETVANSPADVADLLPGDTVVKFNEMDIASFEDLLNAVSSCKPGDTVVLVVDRDDGRKSVEILLISRGELLE
jgi:uncharacterized protein